MYRTSRVANLDSILVDLAKSRDMGGWIEASPPAEEDDLLLDIMDVVSLNSPLTN